MFPFHQEPQRTSQVSRVVNKVTISACVVAKFACDFVVYLIQKGIADWADLLHNFGSKNLTLNTRPSLTWHKIHV